MSHGHDELCDMGFPDRMPVQYCPDCILIDSVRVRTIKEAMVAIQARATTWQDPEGRTVTTVSEAIGSVRGLVHT